MIGPYRIERELGRGGMGVVYLAHDTRLDRTVALKALPEEVSRDPERLSRFEREAKLLASLNHTNIGAIYDVVESEGRRFLALEHVEGETLAQRLTRGALPIPEALEICLQIATGLEAAHERGVIHRDLKPGNVMITSGDQVKIVDFGLAKGAAGAESGLSESPTVTTSSPTITSPVAAPGTMTGVILGTAPYLSPEQARGKAVDRRTDIWSLGCTLYECLTGRKAFHGETVSDTVAAILKGEPDWAALPGDLPPRVRELLRRCLEKDPRQRLRDVGEARILLTSDGGKHSADARDHLRAPVASRTILALVAFGLVMTLAAAWGLSRDLLRPKHRVKRLSIAIPTDLRVQQADITPDGRKIVAIATPTGSSGPNLQRLYVRDLARASFEMIPGTERARALAITPDSRWAVYVARVSEQTEESQMFRVPLDASGPPVKAADWAADWGTGLGMTCVSGNEALTWTDHGRAYVRIPLDGRAASKPIGFNAKGYGGQFFGFGAPLPGGRCVWVEGISYEGTAFHRDIGVLDLKNGKTKVVVRDAGCPWYSPTGHILYTRGSVLMSAPFNRRTLEITGPEAAIASDLRAGSPTDNARFDLSEDGTLQTAPGGYISEARRTVIVDSRGHMSDWSREGTGRARNAPRPSPDGLRIAWVNPNASLIDEIWLSERGGLASTRLVAVPGADCFSPVWSPDGRHLAYVQLANSDKDGIYVVDVNGGAPVRIARGTKAEPITPSSWSADGWILGTRDRGTGEIVLLDSTPHQGGLSEPVLVFGDAVTARFSPDGRAVAYISWAPGRYGFVCVSRWAGLAPAGESLPIGRGTNPIWSPDGRRVLYRQNRGTKIFSAKVTLTPRVAASSPTVVWDLDSLRVPTDLYDMLPDGRIVAVQKAAGEDEITRFDITLNFFEDLKAKMRARGERR